MNGHVLVYTALGTMACFPSPGQSFDPKLTTSVYGDVGAVLRDTARPEHSRAQLGQLAVQGIGQLDDHWGMLAEAVLEYNDDTHETTVDLERLFLTYTLNDQWSFGLGKRHTPLGYWNNAYHHGALFQPTIERPSLVAFEDDGGLLPAHDTGLWGSGRNLGPTRVSVETMVSNGQTGNQKHDANHAKAVTLHVDSQMGGGAVLGLSFRKDLLAAGAALNGRSGTVALDTDVTYAGADLRIDRAPFLLLAEYMRIRESDATGAATDWGWFAYAGWTAGSWTPYVLYERQGIDGGTRIYAQGVAETRWNAAAGLRYAFASPVNLKLEVSHGKAPATDAVQDKIQLAAAFGF